MLLKRYIYTHKCEYNFKFDQNPYCKAFASLISQKCECDFNMYDAQILKSFQKYVVRPQHNAVIEMKHNAVSKNKEMPYPKEDRTPARNNPMTMNKTISI